MAISRRETFALILAATVTATTGGWTMATPTTGGLTADQDKRLTTLFNERRKHLALEVINDADRGATFTASELLLSTYNDLQTLRQEVGELRADVKALLARP